MKTILTICLVLTSFVMLADTAKTVKPTNPITVTPSVQISEKTNTTEPDAYKMLYENAKENNNKTTSLIEWVIGIAVTFLLAIFGAQIYFNIRVNKTEIDYIKKDIEEKISVLKTDMILSIENKSKESENKIETQNKELQVLIDKKITETSTLLKADIKDKFDSRIKIFTLQSESAEKRIESEVKKLQIDIEKNSGDIWKLRGVESAALSAFLRTALLQIEMKREEKYVLDDIISILKSLEEIHKYDREKLDELVGKIKPENKTQKDIIISLYDKKPVYHYVDRPGAGLLRSIYGTSNYGMPASTKEYVKNEPTANKGLEDNSKKNNDI